MGKLRDLDKFDNEHEQHLSDDHGVRIGVANAGRKLTEERIERIRQNSLKQRHSEETKIKIGKRKTGVKLGPSTEEHKSNISKAQLENGGNGPSNHTEETKIKIAKKLSGKKHSDQHRANISAGQLGGKGRQPLLTPHGVFKSRAEAIKNLKGIVNNIPRVIAKLTKVEDSGWKYISKEEYIMLTGKDL